MEMNADSGWQKWALRCEIEERCSIKFFGDVACAAALLLSLSPSSMLLRDSKLDSREDVEVATLLGTFTELSCIFPAFTSSILSQM